MEEYPNSAFYVDNGYTLRKHHIDAIYNMLEPDVGWIYKSPDMYKKGWFWSGQTDSIGGMDVAKKIAKNKGGVTLESTIDDTNIVMPEWDFNAPSSVTAWEEASNVYAEQVSGEIRAVVGSELRPGNIWENIELPRLKANPNVTKITTIDPKTGVEKIIFER